jgi:hypothetical protein
MVAVQSAHQCFVPVGGFESNRTPLNPSPCVEMVVMVAVQSAHQCFVPGGSNPTETP